jgi:hypothetical protein
MLLMSVLVLGGLFCSEVVMYSAVLKELKFISIVTGMCFLITVDVSTHIPL